MTTTRKDSDPRVVVETEDNVISLELWYRDGLPDNVLIGEDEWGEVRVGVEYIADVADALVQIGKLAGVIGEED